MNSDILHIFHPDYTICATGTKLKQNPEMPRKCRLKQQDIEEFDISSNLIGSKLIFSSLIGPNCHVTDF